MMSETKQELFSIICIVTLLIIRLVVFFLSLTSVVRAVVI